MTRSDSRGPVEHLSRSPILDPQGRRALRKARVEQTSTQTQFITQLCQGLPPTTAGQGWRRRCCIGLYKITQQTPAILWTGGTRTAHGADLCSSQELADAQHFVMAIRHQVRQAPGRQANKANAPRKGGAKNHRGALSHRAQAPARPGTFKQGVIGYQKMEPVGG